MIELDIEIIHRDKHLVVVEKPGGLLAVPGRGPARQDCVVRRLQQRITGCPEQPAVHRLDQATSGLMVLALTRESHRHLSCQFSGRQVAKKYVALLAGRVKGEKGEIALKFRLDPDNRPWQVYDPVQGKLGISRWQRLEVKGNITRVAFVPLTGRTHQLRLHASHEQGLGCPILGDSLYGDGSEGDPMMLHASELVFVHPANGKQMRFQSSVPF